MKKSNLSLVDRMNRDFDRQYAYARSLSAMRPQVYSRRAPTPPNWLTVKSKHIRNASKPFRCYNPQELLKNIPNLDMIPIEQAKTFDSTKSETTRRRYLVIKNPKSTQLRSESRNKLEAPFTIRRFGKQLSDISNVINR